VRETGELSEEIQGFIRNYLDSLEELEILLLLHSQSGKDWTVQSVNESIRSSMNSVQQRLEKLRSAGFLSFDASQRIYRYSPATAELAKTVDLLSNAYREKRLKCIEAIFSKPVHDIRSFSDAFRLRGKKPHG